MSFNIPGYDLGRRNSTITDLVKEYKQRIEEYQIYDENTANNQPFISFAEPRLSIEDVDWKIENHKRFIEETPNEIVTTVNYLSDMGYVMCMKYALDASYIIVAHSTGLIQMRHGGTGTVIATLRNMQFPHKPIHSLHYSKREERICYAACSDGVIYRIEIPNISASIEKPPEFCIKADPALESLNMQFYGAPPISTHCAPFITQRVAALSLGISADQSKMVAGYKDASIKVYDMETQEATVTYKIHKLRIQFIPKKLQRNHTSHVCALRCHRERPYVFASASWDDTLRIWDTRCKVGCVMTFEVPNICTDSIDINRDHCVTGSWTPTEALSVWDLVAKKRLNVIRVQNRRPDVDGEYIYACRYWKSTDYNRKGKYVIVGGSGTECLEVINLHNRYIACSYPASGTILAVSSHQDRIAFGGTAPVFNIVTFRDPKHEKYDNAVDDNSNTYEFDMTVFDNDSIYSVENLV